MALVRIDTNIATYIQAISARNIAAIIKRIVLKIFFIFNSYQDFAYNPQG